MISVTITDLTQLAEPDIRAMQSLYHRYFLGARDELFRRDLAEKDWVIILRDNDTIAGFSTQKLIPLTVCGQACQFLFSGDTVVDQPYWNQPGLAGGWGHLAMKLAAERDGHDLFWFLISKGFRTYRFLSTFFRHYHPGPHPTAEAATFKPLLNAIATARYGTAYDPTSGIIRLAGTGDRLADNWSGVAPHRLNDAHVAFFLATNPRWREGDELACLAPISYENLNQLGRRVIRTTVVTWVGA